MDAKLATDWLGRARITVGSASYWAEQGDCPAQTLACLRELGRQIERARRALEETPSAQISARHNGANTMFSRMPWDEARDGAEDEIAAERAGLEVEATERAFAAELRAESPDRPGLAKTHPPACGHSAYSFELVDGLRRARCSHCPHTWAVVLGKGSTDHMPADLPGIAIR